MKRKLGMVVAASMVSMLAMGAFHAASANTIDVYDAAANSITIDAHVSSVPTTAAIVIQGFAKPFNVINNLSNTRADEITLPNSNPSTELNMLNNLVQPDVFGFVRICNSGVACGLSIIINTAYFAMKFGRDTAFFKNVSGHPITITLTTGQASGLSHVTVFGDALPSVPAPAALPLLLTGLGGLGWLARRRRKAAA